MTRNPLVNACIAALYILGLVFLIFYGGQQLFPEGDPDTILMPVMMLCLLVLSVLVMGYVLLSQPVRMLLAGEVADGMRLLVRTILIFGAITLLVVALVAATILRT